MPQTYFKNLLRSHGRRVTVEYQWDDETCVSIVAKWPNTEEYSQLTAERSALEAHGPSRLCEEFQEKLRELDGLIEGLEVACLSEQEIERVEHWLSENCRQFSDIAF